MRAITMMQAQWKTDTDTGEALHFEACKGGYFSDREEFALKITGKTAQNATPSPDSPVPIRCVKAGTKVLCCGKNLFDISEIKNNDPFVVNNGDGTLTVTPIAENALCSTKKTLSELCQVLAVGNVAVLNFTTTSAVKYIYINGYGIWKKGSALTVTQKMLDGVVGFYGDHPDLTPRTISEIQIELGDTPTAYEPYVSGGELTVPCDLYEGDVWYPTLGKVIRENGVKTLDGTETWNPNYTPNTLYYYYDKTITDGRGWCERAKYVGKTEIGSVDGYNYYAGLSGSGNGIVFLDLGKTSLTEHKAFLSENPTGITYRLSTPTVEQYDPQPVFAPSGTVNVSQVPTEEAANLTAAMLIRR